MTLDTVGLISHPTPSPYPFGPASVADILERGLREFPERMALIDGDRSWTWASLDEAVRSVAGGISPGERIWWALDNSATAIIGALATWRSGGVWIGATPQRPQSVLPYLAQQLGPITLVDDPSEIPRGRAAHGAVNPHSVAAITFTSGTSGRAKAVAHSQHNLLWPGLISAELEPPTDEERIGSPLSLTIANIMVLGPLSALLRGSCYVVMDRTFATGFSSDVARHKVTRSFVVPTMLHDLVHAKSIDPASLASLARVIVGGSGADPNLLAAFTKRFGVRPTLSYGLTEAPTGVVRESLADPIGSGRGFPLPHVEVLVLDPDGNPAPSNVEGEVCLRPSRHGAWANTWTPTLGYIGDQERTDALFAGGVLHTGDIGRLDEDGALSVTGRLSNVIIRGAMNIDPIAVERVLLADPSVADAVVVGVQDDRLGERIGAIVVPTKGMSIDRSHLRLMVEMQVSKHAVPDVILTDEHLMRTEMGKLVRNLPPELFDGGDRDPGPTTTELRNDGGNVEG